MTDIAVFTYQVLPENLTWDLSNPEVPYAEGGTLDVSLFNQPTHFANGFIPSGTVLGRVTASGSLGPYLGSLADGRQVAVGILRASVGVVQQSTGALKTRLGVSVLEAFGVISVAKLPFTVGNAPLGGYLDAAARTALPRLHFAA